MIPVPPIITPQPRVWPVFVIYVVAVMTVLVAVGLWVALLAAARSANVQAVVESASGQLGALLLTMAVVASAAMAGALWSPVPWCERLRLGRVDTTLLDLSLATVGTLGIGFVLQGLTGLGWIPPSPALQLVDKLIRGLSPVGLAVAVVVIGILPGICEELLFRGYIQTRLRQRWGAGWAIAVTSVLFGIMHFDWIHSAFAVGIGIWLGYLTERTGSIRPAMVCHAANNVVSTLLCAANFEFTGATAGIVVLAGGVAAIVGAAWRLRSRVFVLVLLLAMAVGAQAADGPVRELKLAKTYGRTAGTFDSTVNVASLTNGVGPFLKQTVDTCRAQAAKDGQSPQSIGSAAGHWLEWSLLVALKQRQLTPAWSQAEFAAVPKNYNDVLLWSKEHGPIVISCKTSLRERYKQADLEAVALRQHYPNAKFLLLTLDDDKRHVASIRKKIAGKELLALHALYDETNADELFAFLKTLTLTDPPDKVLRTGTVVR